VLPKKNQKDLVEIPPRVKRDLKLILVESMDEVLPIALTEMGQPAPKRTPRRRRTSTGPTPAAARAR